ncbi:MAG: acyl-ACP thioesterase [Spirochaetaceae bacterium]|jgi:acyl-ACP thioesterase|nr:acyl-ACP thioesterase [Spirochaetaceae bacterium]
MDVWEEEAAVTLGDVDRTNRVKPSAFFRYFQHATSLHGDALGIGAAQIAASGQGWVLSRFSVEIETRPALSDRLTVRTWPRGFRKLFALRDYEITGAGGQPVARARSGWLVIDIHRRRPLREESLCRPLPANAHLPDMLPEASALADEYTGTQKTGEKTPAYSDTDYNGHVNNVRYVEWVEDCAGFETLSTAEKFRLDINFVNELLPGQTAGIYATPPGPRMYVEARRLDDKVPIFRAALTAPLTKIPATR